jgi:hypothetical protein
MVLQVAAVGLASMRIPQVEMQGPTLVAEGEVARIINTVIEEATGAMVL